MRKSDVHVQGTHVVSGDGLCVVLRTGNQTYIAGIAQALAAKGHMNAFDYAVRRVVYVFIIFVVVMVPLVIVLNGLSTGKCLNRFGLVSQPSNNFLFLVLLCPCALTGIAFMSPPLCLRAMKFILLACTGQGNPNIFNACNSLVANNVVTWTSHKQRMLIYMSYVVMTSLDEILQGTGMRH